MDRGFSSLLDDSNNSNKNNGETTTDTSSTLQNILRESATESTTVAARVGTGKAVKQSRGGRGRVKPANNNSRQTKVERVMEGLKGGLFGIDEPSTYEKSQRKILTSSSNSDSSSPPSTIPSPVPFEKKSERKTAKNKKTSKAATNKSIMNRESGLITEEQFKYLKDFNPRNSNRCRRKKDRIEYFDAPKINKLPETLVHDHRGHFIATDKSTSNMCDCLQNDCPGCHFPCPKCRSPKCGAECRISRKWFYDRVDVEGTEQFYINSKVKS